jgi:hypothetical protein
VQGKVAASYVDAGEQSLKNIARPVRVYRVELDKQRAAEPAAPTLPLPDKPSIAVLPFQNMSGDPEQEYFTDGMVEDIVTGLSRIKWLFVIARNSSFTYKNRAIDVKQVGRELGVPCVLGDRNAARFGDPFDPRRDVDAVAQDVLALDDDIADVDPDPEPDRIDFGATGILLAKLSLDFDSASDGVHGACELHQRAVAHELDDTARMAGDCRID